MTPLFTVSSSAVNGITGYISDLFSSVSGLLWLIIGIPLAFYVIHKIIGLLPKR